MARAATGPGNTGVVNAVTAQPRCLPPNHAIHADICTRPTAVLPNAPHGRLPFETAHPAAGGPAHV
eukprot:8526866-Lingulodinium_polyedra.AAC.1